MKTKVANTLNDAELYYKNVAKTAGPSKCCALFLNIIVNIFINTSSFMLAY